MRIWSAKPAVVLLAFAMLLAVYSRADAVEFKASGEWNVGFAVGDGSLIRKREERNLTANDDGFGARQRFRLQLDAVASEALSGTVFFEIGDQTWGRDADDDGLAGEGGALGADGTRAIKLKNAYIDWIAPTASQDLRFRMGIQALALPNAAGGSAVLDADVAGVSASYRFNENIGLTVAWMRPLNDNFAGWTHGGNGQVSGANYLDNMDLLAVSLPMTFEGVKLTPWIMYGILGKHALHGIDGEDHFRYAGHEYVRQPEWKTREGHLSATLTNYVDELNDHGLNDAPLSDRGKPYFSMFWAGLPVVIDLWDPLRIEFDVNYGYVESMGRYDVLKRDMIRQRADSRRQGWLVKALVEYKLDWGVPGIFGWYASGDDGNMKNGSERMPSIAGKPRFTSFSGYGGLDWGAKKGMVEWHADAYSGTWGVGLQLRDVSFLEDLKHTFRVVWWGGTNSPSMVKYLESRDAWFEGGFDKPYLNDLYLTTHDSMLEFNLDNQYKIYENLTVHLDLGYVVNMVDTKTWNRGWMEPESRGTQKQDAWKAQVAFVYTF